jgi:hypothetical protein
LDGLEGGDPVGLVLDLGEGDGEGVSHGDAERLSIEGVAAARREDDWNIGPRECGGGAEDGSEVVVVGEVFEDDEGAGGLEEVVELGLIDAVSGGEESSVDGVSGDLVEGMSGSGVDGDFFGDPAQEFGVRLEFGFVDEDGVEWITRVDVVLENEGAFGDEELVFLWLVNGIWVMGGFEPGISLIAVWLNAWVIRDL